jgi:Rrf2 family protein
MWLNSTAQTALNAVLHIARQPGEDPIRVDEIASSTDAPRNYLSKTLHALGRAGVLRSWRGPKGGFQLARPATELSLAEVVAPFSPANGRRCLIGKQRCSDLTPCAAHHSWAGVANNVERYFAETTIADLAHPTPAPSALHDLELRH